MDRPSLRERKKILTRQRISDIATELFVARGFDNVTVAEIAERADVSKMTVLNYFPRKEDLLLDRGPEAVEMLTTAVREREPGTSVLAALRDAQLSLVRQRHPLSGVGDGRAAFYRVVADSPALRARVRESVQELEEVLTGLLAKEMRAGEPTVRLAAAMIVGVLRTTHLTAARRGLTGEHAAVVTPAQLRLIRRCFDRLARAFPELA